MNPARLQVVARMWRRRTIAREVLAALGASCALAAFALGGSSRGVPWATAAGLALAGFGVVLGLRLLASRPWRLDAVRVSRHLDRTYPELEESSALWLRAPGDLSLPERLQRQRLDAAFAGLEKRARDPVTHPPRGFLRPAVILFTVGVVVLAAALAWRLNHHRQPLAAETFPDRTLPVEQAAAAPPPSATAPLPLPRIARAELVITPPAYTGRPERRIAGLEANTEVEAGANVAWRVTFVRPDDVRDAHLVFSQTDALPLIPAAGESGLEARRVLTDSILYSFAGTLVDGRAWSLPEVHALKIRPDASPTLTVLQPASPRTVVEPPAAEQEPPGVTIEVLAGDDYGVTKAHLIATVAKGSGEGVKFREQRITFDTVTGPPTARRFSRTLSLGALGLEPGDELYFYVEAQDNREPTPNSARSETRFVTLRGAEEKTAAPARGMAGVNLVPEYFRSQRQLIIDTEKLVADRAVLADAEFRQRSNELGIDQDLLRLRYGQFLGEESEGGAGDGHDEDDATKAAPDMGVPPTAEQILAPYVDQHDAPEKATFFDRETKGTLRDALGAMWEAEGFLRTARPAEALPAENRALVILKDLQQSARAYVQRVGFEPPPLKVAERRLRGDVTDVPAQTVTPPVPPTAGENALAPLRAALREVRWESAPLSPQDRALLQQTEGPLTEAATRRPEEFLAGLSALRRVLSGDDPNMAGDHSTVAGALWKLLPPAQERPARRRESAPTLVDPYFQALDVGAGAVGAASRP